MSRFSRCVAGIMLIPAVAFANALPAKPYIQVSGHGTLSVTPDLARLSATVEKTDKDLAAARTDVEHRVGKVVTAAKQQGIAERDIDALNISVWPEYRWQNGNQIFMGQHVSRRIEITLRDISRYADLVEALVKAGVTNIGNATLDRSDMPKLREQVLAAAMKDAHARALALADAAGVNLGTVYSITENSGFTPRPLMAGVSRSASSSSGVEYEPGSIEVSADVSIVYLLKEAN
jgi:uncharacterized protein